MKSRIVADSRFDGHGQETIALGGAACRAWIERALDDKVDAAVVLGDDATLAAFATAHAEVARHRSDPIWFAPVPSGELDHVAAQVDAGRASARALRKLVKRIEADDARRTTVATLRIVDSARPEPRLGFTFGMGAFTQMFGPGGERVRRRDAVKNALGGEARVDADVRIDWKSHATQFGYLIASSLDSSWARVKMGGPATVRLGGSSIELLRGATTVGRAFERAAGGTATPFGCVHIDTNSDYVVDGMLVAAGTPRLIALTPGPQLRILV